MTWRFQVYVSHRNYTPWFKNSNLSDVATRIQRKSRVFKYCLLNLEICFKFFPTTEWLRFPFENSTLSELIYARLEWNWGLFSRCLRMPWYYWKNSYFYICVWVLNWGELNQGTRSRVKEFGDSYRCCSLRKKYASLRNPSND
jgi:hypothetical protein